VFLLRSGAEHLQIGMSLTKLEYRVWRQADEHPEIQQMKGQLSMADDRIRVDAERLGIDPLNISIQIDWTGETGLSLYDRDERQRLRRIRTPG
jgi:hypothetical protein